MAIKPYLQLVRLPNLFTAAADSLAGWLIVTGSLAEPGRWLPMVLASVSIYAGGIVLNDVFDFEIDRRERPGRPLPSGRVRWTLAAWFGGIALGLGPVLAGLSGSMTSFVVALALAACVLGYDSGLKRTLMGPQVMGACRGLNLLLGMSQAPGLGGPGGWLIAGMLAVFVAGVTWISRSEVETGKTRGLVAGLVLQDVAFLGLMYSCMRPSLFPIGDSSVLTRVETVEGLILLALIAGVVNRAGLRAFRRPVPETFQKAVKTGVLSLVWLDVAVVVAGQGPMTGGLVAMLWVPAFVIGRWLYST